MRPRFARAVRSFVFALLATALFGGCAREAPPASAAPRLPVHRQPPNAAAPEVPRLRHATNLRFTAIPGGLEITIPEPWADGAPIRYAVVRGEFEAGAAHRGLFRSAPQRVVAMVTPAIAHLRDLGMLDRLVAVEEADLVFDETVREGVAGGRIAEVGGGAELDLERVVALRPDLVLLSALGPDDVSVRRLEAVGVPVVIVADWREATPLGRAEWITLFGALFGRVEEAQALFARRERDYLLLRDLASGVAPADRPQVMANGPWQGAWPVPAGGSYMARLFADAGGEYLWSDLPGTGSHLLDLEAVLERARDADVWVNLNFDWRTRSDVLRTDPRLSLFAPFASGRMYHHDLRVNPAGASDFWEKGATRPDLVLADLVSIFHPKLLPEHQHLFYRRLPER